MSGYVITLPHCKCENAIENSWQKFWSDSRLVPAKSSSHSSRVASISKVQANKGGFVMRCVSTESRSVVSAERHGSSGPGVDAVRRDV